MAVTKSQVEPFAIPFRRAIEAEGISHTKGYALCKSGQWESFIDGFRYVTVASIKARRERLLAASRIAPKLRGRRRIDNPGPPRRRAIQPTQPAE